MKKLTLLLLLIAAGLQAQTQSEFCIKNGTYSNNYQIRVEYSCPSGSHGETMAYTNWYEINAGPNNGTCIPNDDFMCKNEWIAKTIEVRTGTSNNAVTISVPSGYPSERKMLIDPLNENMAGAITWQFLNAVVIE
jgi:hypothetical protein